MSEWVNEMANHMANIQRDGFKQFSKSINKSNNTKTAMENTAQSQPKCSVVTNVQANGSFDSTYGTFYRFEIEFENGDAGQYSSKSQAQTKFVIGQEAFYTLATNGKFTNVKPAENPSAPRQSFGGGGGGKSFGKSPEESDRISRMNSLTNAINWHVAHGGDLVDVLSTASSFENFIKNGNK